MTFKRDCHGGELPPNDTGERDVLRSRRLICWVFAKYFAAGKIIYRKMKKTVEIFSKDGIINIDGQQWQ
jgi:hypothetical protein